MKHGLRMLTTLGFAALLITQPGGSCVTDGTGSPGDPDTTPPTPTGVNAPPSSTPPAEAVDPNYIPSRAVIVKDGRGPLEYVADADGTVYVQNVKREQTIVSHRIHRGEKLTVTPDENRVRLDDDTLSRDDIKSDAEHRIYILRDRRFDDRDQADDRPDSDKYDRLPSRAEKIDEGKGRTLATWVQRDGRMYVYDVDARQVATSVKVLAGQRFVFSPADDRITLNGDTVSTKNFSTKTNYRIYLGDAR